MNKKYMRLDIHAGGNTHNFLVTYKSGQELTEDMILTLALEKKVISDPSEVTLIKRNEISEKKYYDPTKMSKYEITDTVLTITTHKKAS